MTAPLDARRILVSGRVQGVFYRDWTVATARALGLCGWVRNLADGRVEILAEGKPESVAALIGKCREGSPASEVRSLDVLQVDPQGFGGFERKPSA